MAPGLYRGAMTTSAEKQPSVVKSEEEWRAQLSPDEYAVLRQAGTERPWTGEYVDTKTVGVYECRACGAELFRSDTKFDSHCGWPSFYEASSEDNVVLREDSSYGMVRTEVLCGYVPQPPGPPVRRRPADPHRRPLLHQLGDASGSRRPRADRSERRWVGVVRGLSFGGHPQHGVVVASHPRWSADARNATGRGDREDAVGGQHVAPAAWRGSSAGGAGSGSTARSRGAPQRGSDEASWG